ncbi:MAG: bifunctional aspartate kinase/homoserine dehydrogenase I [Deltaproteobacteria bacterium]|nr:bifunctional aspartate kinase/homoserine dehydrogenase I [Deltaproteobacteria bacterium]
MTSWVVHKFGGTSLADADRYRAVADILANSRKATERRAIVVSAMSKVTDALLACVERARTHDPTYPEALEALGAKHTEALEELSRSDPHEAWSRAQELVLAELRDLREILRGIFLTRSAADRAIDLIAGHGELWSARALSTLLVARKVPAAWLDAREVLVVQPGSLAVDIVWDTSRGRTQKWLESADVAQLTDVVITGFIAETPEGLPTTLGRNGSDYSASIFGALLGAREITIWTDVDGVLSADPRKVPEAVVLDELSYDEATELAYFGAKVVHPSTMAPAIHQSIPIWIRNTFNPTHPGTKIHAHSWQSTDGPTIKGFATIDDIALVNVEGTGMIGVPGVAHRLFGALRDAGLSVVMISQASSEHSICFGLPEAQAARAKEVVERAFFLELQHGQIERVEVIDHCSILAAVGDGMVERRGVAGRFFSALGSARVNVRAIAQGSSERNISAVIRRDEAIRALRAVHSGFFLSDHTLSIGVVGVGLIGTELLRQLEAQRASLRTGSKLDLRVRALANSRKMSLADRRIEGSPLELLRDEGVPTDLERLADHVQADHLPHAVIVDCTASQDVASLHPAWLERGIHVITANKRGVSGDLELYRRIKDSQRARGAFYLESTTVGAGLPIIRTLRDLILTGDSVERIEGVLSGTLSYLFNTFGEIPLETSAAPAPLRFSELVREARARGYTEPDPRDDLSGADVARKLVTLAREIGLPLRLDELPVESLVPAELLSGDAAAFLDRLPDFDATWSERLARARESREVLRYVAVIERSGSDLHARVELRSYPMSHAFARIRATDNIVAIQTRRYHDQPLVIQGPGAGPAVTAGGVFSDLLRLSTSLGRPQ